MQNKSVFVLAVVALFATSAFAASCLEKLPMQKTFGEAITGCFKTLKLNTTDFEPGKLKDQHFHDHCMSNCTLESLQFYRNGTILKDTILAQLKKEAASDVYDKLAKVVETCTEKANTKPEHKKKKDKKMTKDIKLHMVENGKKCNCKKAAKFLFCMIENDKDLC